MKRVALTGGIATGKSYVLARFAAAGIPTVDADRLVHDALGPGSPAVPLIASRFGPGVVGPGGAIDRQALGAVVFSDARARRDLEAILHPHVYRIIDEWFASLSFTRPTSPIRPTSPTSPLFAVADIPLLYETGHDKFFDVVIVTTCSRELQLRRLNERGMSDEQAAARLEAQWPIEEKARRADYVIDTSGTFEDTDRRVNEVIDRLRAEG